MSGHKKVADLFTQIEIVAAESSAGGVVSAVATGKYNNMMDRQKDFISNRKANRPAKPKTTHSCGIIFKIFCHFAGCFLRTINIEGFN